MQLLTRKFTVEQYHKMVDVGILSEQDRVELIRGEIIEMSPIGLKHAACIKRLNQLFSKKLGDLVLIGIQDPVQLNDISQPQPDVVLLKPRDDFYQSRVPQAEDILLLIEVSDTTLKYDRETKIPLYGENAIQEVWLVDLNQHYLEVYRQPLKKGYQNIQKLQPPGIISLSFFPSFSLNLDEILFSNT